MIQINVQDGKKNNRSLEVNGFIKPSGMIVASVKNDRSETYFVQIRKDGTASCKTKSGDVCPGHHYAKKCYHVDAVKAAMLPTYNEVAVSLPCSLEYYAIRRIEEIALNTKKRAEEAEVARIHAEKMDAIATQINEERGAQVIRRGIAPIIPVVQPNERSTASLQRGLYLLPKTWQQIEDESQAKKGIA